VLKIIANRFNTFFSTPLVFENRTEENLNSSSLPVNRNDKIDSDRNAANSFLKLYRVGDIMINSESGFGQRNNVFLSNLNSSKAFPNLKLTSLSILNDFLNVKTLSNLTDTKHLDEKTNDLANDMGIPVNNLIVWLKKYKSILDNPSLPTRIENKDTVASNSKQLAKKDKKISSKKNSIENNNRLSSKIDEIINQPAEINYFSLDLSDSFNSAKNMLDSRSHRLVESNNLSNLIDFRNIEGYAVFDDDGESDNDEGDSSEDYDSEELMAESRIIPGFYDSSLIEEVDDREETAFDHMDSMLSEYLQANEFNSGKDENVDEKNVDENEEDDEVIK
jgi:hypothetical protein